MNARASLTASFFFMLIALFSSCALNPEWKLERSLERLQEGDASSIKDIESALLDLSTVESLDVSDLVTNGNVLYTTKGDAVTVRYPFTKTYTFGDDKPATLIDMNTDYAVISDGQRMAVYRVDGKRLEVVTLADRKPSVSSLALAADMVIYYRGEALYAYRILHRTKERFTAETFPSPYQKYYAVQMRVYDNLLLVVAGIAGSYNGSIVDIDTRKVIIKNIAMASSRCYLNTQALYYCTGSAGQWQMVRFSLADKAKKTIASFTDITDIHCAAQGYILETSTGRWIAAYGESMVRIPFPFEPAGVYKYRPILKYHGTSYIIDMKRFISTLEQIQQAAPSLFEEEKK